MMDIRARIRMAIRYLLIAAGVLVLAGVFGGLAVMISGVVPIKASSGHWPITAAILDFAKRRSVNTHTLRVKVPPLDDQRLVLRGAGHYDFACEPCHGSPAVQQPRIAASMTPKPPDLRGSALSMPPEDLFYIVTHGIKFTGMPAWPTQHRDDEVWAVVAFLRRLPALTPAHYDELTGATRAASDDRTPFEDLLGPSLPVPDAIGENCARCHGLDGLGRGGAFPRLAGQRSEYLEAALVAYSRGERHSGFMEPVAANLGVDDMRAIARYYASRPPGPPSLDTADGADIEQGRQIATHGMPERLIPACSECHGPATTPRNRHYPVLAGQHADFLELQLSLFKGNRRGGSPYHLLMQKVAGQLTDEQVRAVAHYYASLPLDASAHESRSGQSGSSGTGKSPDNQ
jgi:cytochrome c553